MIIYKSPINNSGKRKKAKKINKTLLLILLFLTTGATGQKIGAQPVSSKNLLPWFVQIEAQDSSSEEVEQALEAILKAGQSAVPSVAQRFRETGNPRYFYLLQKLKKQHKIQPPGTWSKQRYFQNRYREARRLFQGGEIVQAKKIAEAIMVLEPTLAIRSELRQFVRKCRNAQACQRLLQATLSASPSYGIPKGDITLRFAMRNKENSPLSLLPGPKSGIVLNMYITDYGLYGHIKQQSSQRIVPFKERKLAPGEAYCLTLRISDLPRKKNLYRIFRFTADMPRCRVACRGESHYLRIEFNPVTTSSFPQHFHHVVRSPLDICRKAIKLGFPEHLFFASFHLKRSRQRQLIPLLIKNLDSRSRIAQISLGILQRLTGKKLTTRADWQNWWDARNRFWQ